MIISVNAVLKIHTTVALLVKSTFALYGYIFSIFSYVAVGSNELFTQDLHSLFIFVQEQKLIRS